MRGPSGVPSDRYGPRLTHRMVETLRHDVCVAHVSPLLLRTCYQPHAVFFGINVSPLT